MSTQQDITKTGPVPLQGIRNQDLYNGKSTSLNLTKEEYWESYTLDMTIDMIFNMLKDVESAEENGIDCVELDYYEAVLK